MTAFFDDFKRANGNVGTAYIGSGNGVWTIASQEAWGFNDGYLEPVESMDSPDQYVRVKLSPNAGSTGNISLSVRKQRGGDNRYYAAFNATASNISVGIYQRLNGVTSGTGTAVINIARVNVNTIAVRVVGTKVTAYVNDEPVLFNYLGGVVDGPAIAVQDSGGNPRIIELYATTEGEQSLTVVATPGETPDDPVTLAVTGSQALWTPGTPGAPAFQVAPGSVVSQSVDSATTATVVWQPPTLDVGAVLIDPLTGQRETLSVSLPGQALPDPGAGSGTFTEADSAMLQSIGVGLGLGVDPTEELNWLKQLEKLLAGPDSYDGELTEWASLFEQIVADIDSQGHDTIRRAADIARQNSASAVAQLNALTGEGAIDLVDLSAEIRGPGSRSVGEVYDKLDGLATATSLQTLAGAFGAMVTASGYTLADVRAWVQAIEPTPPDLTSVVDAVNTARDAIQGTIGTAHGVTDAAIAGAMASILGAIATGEAQDVTEQGEVTAGFLATAGTLAGIVADLADLKGRNPTVTVDLSEVLAKLDQTNSAIESVQDDLTAQIAALSSRIAAVETAIGRRTRPLWPGNGHLVFGQTVTIEGEGTVIGPMDGVRIEVLGAPGEIGHQSFNGSTRYLYLGKLAFIGPNGAYDEEQQIRWKSGTYSPLNACTADLVSIKCRPGTTLSIQPWSHASS